MIFRGEHTLWYEACQAREQTRRAAIPGQPLIPRPWPITRIEFLRLPGSRRLSIPLGLRYTWSAPRHPHEMEKG